MSERAVLAAVPATVYVTWGSTYVAIRVLVETVPPVLGAGERFLAAGAVLAQFVAARGVGDPVRARQRHPGDRATAIVAAVALVVTAEGRTR